MIKLGLSIEDDGLDNEDEDMPNLVVNIKLLKYNFKKNFILNFY